MTSVGAQLAHAAGAQYVLAFGHEVGDNPTRAAANAGEMIVARGLTKRALVDLASVSIQARPDGTRRYQSPLFAKKEQYPGESDPEGILLSPAALEVLPDLPVEPVPGRPGTSRLQKATQAAERTTTRMGVAPLVGRDELLRTLLESARAAASGSTPTIVTLLGRARLRQDPPRADAGAAPRGGPDLRDAVRARQGGAGRRRGADHARAPALDAVAARRGAAGSRARAARRAARRRARQGGLGRRGGRHGVGAARAPRAARADRRAGRHPRRPPRAPPARRCARKARKRALAVVVEDAHFVDETALDALEYAALAEAGCPIWICVVGRPSFGRGRTDWAGRAAARREITLPALEPAAAAELARRLLLARRERAGDARWRCLAARTEGIPLLAGRAGARAQARRPGAQVAARGRAGRSPPTSSIACPICRSCSGWPAARPSRCRPI